jgi:SAM-dependent methyltransferase
MLLVGCQCGLDAIRVAEKTNTLRLGSTLLSDSPHVAVLEYASRLGRALSDEEIVGSDYWAFAQGMIEMSGDFFGARTDSELLSVVRSYVDWALGNGPRVTMAWGTSPEHDVLVARIVGTPYFQVVDGHHRAAVAILRGEAELRVRRTWFDVETPLQVHLEEMSWLAGQGRLLYQPLAAPELTADWEVVRDCRDRLAKMLGYLGASSDRLGRLATYLDVGSCYGWFLGEMKELGYEVAGIERDFRAKALGVSFYGLDTDEIIIGDAVEMAEKLEDGFDAVSCFSLIHHFVLAEGRPGARRLIEALDGVTNKVLFLDSGEDTEAWFHGRVRDWNSKTIPQFVLDNSSFTDVADLGTDHDGIGRWKNNYGRHLFAFTRSADRVPPTT